MDARLRQTLRDPSLDPGQRAQALAMALRLEAIDEKTLNLLAFLGDEGARALLGPGAPFTACDRRHGVLGLRRWGRRILVRAALVSVESAKLRPLDRSYVDEIQAWLAQPTRSREEEFRELVRKVDANEPGLRLSLARLFGLADAKPLAVVVDTMRIVIANSGKRSARYALSIVDRPRTPWERIRSEVLAWALADVANR